MKSRERGTFENIKTLRTTKRQLEYLLNQPVLEAQTRKSLEASVIPTMRNNIISKAYKNKEDFVSSFVQTTEYRPSVCFSLDNDSHLTPSADQKLKQKRTLE